MGEIEGSRSWTEELASLVEDTGIIYHTTTGDTISPPPPPAFKELKASQFKPEPTESLKDQVKEFAKAWGEIGIEMGRGCRDIVQQTILTEDSVIVQKSSRAKNMVSGKLGFLNEFLPEDRDPIHAWAVVFFVFILALSVGQSSAFTSNYPRRMLPGYGDDGENTEEARAFERCRDLNRAVYTCLNRENSVVPLTDFKEIALYALLCVNTKHETSVSQVKKIQIHPANATRILLPDGRHMAYHEQGVPSRKARFSLIATHSFLSSRLAGIPGVDMSLLEEFGVRLVTYDLPGYGESDPHPNRSLHSSAMDILHLAEAVEINDKFWILGYSSGAMHTWAALKYIPDRIAGAVMFAPWVNPYEPGLTKDEKLGIWEKWPRRRRLMYYLARRFPKFLSSFYRRTFYSGKHGQIDKWLSMSLANKDRTLIENPAFEEFWQRDVEESIRQGSMNPFIEEATLQVSDWKFGVADLQVQKKCPGKGFFHWFNFMHNQAECELIGFLGPIHIWQGMNDEVVPPPMADYVARVLPSVTVHKLLEDGHFSYFFFCNECHRNIFSNLFGSPQGPIEINEPMQAEGDVEEASTVPGTSAE